jgi:hypothetical protein
MDAVPGAAADGSSAAAATEPPRPGRVFVMSGRSTASLRRLAPPSDQHLALFGYAVAGPGDVNDDGIPDLAVGAPGDGASGLKEAGRVYLFSGADGSLLREIDPPAPRRKAMFGYALAAAGDLDGDGDLVVGAPGEVRPGKGRTGAAYIVGGAEGRSWAPSGRARPGAGRRSGRAWPPARTSPATDSVRSWWARPA